MNKPLTFKGNFINGSFHVPRGGREILSEDPGDLDNPVGTIREDLTAVEEAVAAARAAWPAWRDLPFEKRLGFVKAYQAALEKRREVLAAVISRETGKTAVESADELSAMIAKVDLTVKEGIPLVADWVFPMETGVRGAIRYRPLGVAGIIGPFNVPGHLPNGQIVPALLTGNTVVFKPSELAPFTGQAVAECFAEAGLPPGVFQLVQGGGETGARLAGRPEVDALFFTGSAQTGARVQAAGQVFPGRLTALEMGGKNAALVFPDAPWEETLDQVLQGAFATTGQRCSSTSRVLLHKEAAARLLPEFLARTKKLSVGYYTERPSMGPLVRDSAVDRFFKAQRTAEDLGFRTILQGGKVETKRRGHYASPSIHLWEGFPEALLRGGPAYWDEELFAPDVAVYVLSSEEEMVRLNNASRFGLAAGVFTSDGARFDRLVRRLENGVVHWNRSTAMTPGRLPFGGLKASGNHRPAGLFMAYTCTAPVASVEKPAGEARG